MSSPKRRKKSADGFRVAFQGATGAFSEVAAGSIFKKTENLEAVGYDTFRSVFEAVDKAEADAAVVPVENSVSGTLKEILSLLVEFEELTITAEASEIESLCLCANKDADSRSIEEVHSDAAHLEQCSKFLSQLGGVKKCLSWDSAGACQSVKETNSTTVAAIASKAAAEAHGLQVLEPNVSNLGGLSTRYVVVRKEAPTPKPGVAQKSSLAVLLRNEPMALMKLVSAFALRGMNITKLESQPACHVRNDMFSGRHFDYLFFVDFEPKDAAVTKMLLANIEEFSISTRHLGTYPKNVALEDVSHTDVPWTAYI